MLSALISSKTRIKLLLKFFINSQTTGYLRGLEAEFGESSNAIRQELNRFEAAGLLISFSEGNKKIFQANTQHPLYREIHNILLKHLGIDTIIENVIRRLGNVEKVYLTGAFAKGNDSQIIDLALFGEIDKVYLMELIEKAEQLVDRKIRFVQYNPAEHETGEWRQSAPEALLLWSC